MVGRTPSDKKCVAPPTAKDRGAVYLFENRQREP